MITFTWADEIVGTIARAMAITALTDARASVLFEALVTREILSRNDGERRPVFGGHAARFALQFAA